MKRDYKNKRMRAAPVNKREDQSGKPEDKIKIFLSGIHREEAERIARLMNISLEELIQRYIAQMVADRRWPV